MTAGLRLQHQWNRLAARDVFTPAFSRYLTHTHVEFSQSLSILQSSMEESLSQSLFINQIALSSSYLEYSNETALLQNLVKTTLETKESETPEEQEDLDIASRPSTSNSIEELLNELNPELIPLWHGAVVARNSGGEDSTRHSSTSLRELSTQVIHTLAPDHEVEQWSNEPSHYSDSKPTRRARLHYIARGVNDAAFSDFIVKDVTAFLELLNLLQKGVHSVESPYSPSQVAAIEIRTEDMLRFLLRIPKL